MSTEYEIQAKYNSAIEMADELDSIASALRKIANENMAETLSALKISWQGANSERFMQKGATVKERVSDTARMVVSAAATLRSNALETYNTEMEVLRIAQKRKTGNKEAFGGGGGGSR